MRKLIMKMSISVDGFVGDANGGNDWIFRSSDEKSKAWVNELFLDAGLKAFPAGVVVHTYHPA